MERSQTLYASWLAQGVFLQHNAGADTKCQKHFVQNCSGNCLEKGGLWIWGFFVCLFFKLLDANVFLVYFFNNYF